MPEQRRRHAYPCMIENRVVPAFGLPERGWNEHLIWMRPEVGSQLSRPVVQATETTFEAAVA